MAWKLVLAAVIALAVASVLTVRAQTVTGQSTDMTVAQITAFTQQDPSLVALMDPPLDPTLDPPNNFHSVSTHIFDPQDTDSIQSDWEKGIGCGNTAATKGTSYQDSICSTGDLRDEENYGLLLAKSGPTPQNAAAFAELHNPKGLVLTDLGYDIRKVPNRFAPNGSHCGAGAPRFNVYTTDGALFFVGCQSPPPTTEMDDVPGMGDAWIRLRWGTGAPGSVTGFSSACPNPNVPCPITGTVQRIFIVFDEGSDTAPDFFGAAVLDNIDVNGQLVGKP
jgi:hypothetical protein